MQVCHGQDSVWCHLMRLYQYRPCSKARIILTNLKKHQHQQAADYLNDRIGQCDAAMSLRTKPLRKMSCDYVNSMVLSLSDYWGILPYDCKGKLADAQSGRHLSELAINDVSRKHIVKRREVLQGYLGMGFDFWFYQLNCHTVTVSVSIWQMGDSFYVWV